MLSFRFCPDIKNNPYYCRIGLALLDENLETIIEPHLINTRLYTHQVQSQSEDAKLFRYQDRIFLIYHDNDKETSPTIKQRRDMFIVEVFLHEGKYLAGPPLKLRAVHHYSTQFWQKNWSAFTFDDQLLISYTINPHEILTLDFATGDCSYYCSSYCPINWIYGKLRGSSNPQLINGEYFGFFHSGRVVASNASAGLNMWHYFFGAYTFSAEPPFALTKISPSPILAEGFYTDSEREKRVIFPGGFEISGDTVYLAYGKDDAEIWIATLNFSRLYASLISLEP